MTITNNITDTALIFEGGGMRGSYTAAVVNTLLDNELYFDYVAGISAGSTNLANYLSRDRSRTYKCFVDFAKDPNLGSLRTFIRGEGIFNSRYIYEETSEPNQALPFDWETFSANPAKYRIGSFNSRTGRTHYWTNEDLDAPWKLLRAMRASSSMPVLMPPVDIRGDLHVDGAVGSSGGIPLDIAIADGYEKFFVVLTRPAEYVKKKSSNPAFYRSALRSMPLVAEAVINRPARYNEMRDQLVELEKQGKAYIFYAEGMMVDTGERDVAKLAQNYRRGLAQAKRELPAWRDFLDV